MVVGLKRVVLYRSGPVLYYNTDIAQDVADALAAVCYHLTHNVNPWGFVDTIEGAGYAAAMASPKAPGIVTPVPYAGFHSALDEIRYRRGMPAR